MPVAVKLSRHFYDRFGDEATNELVALLNDVDLTYRSELKDAFASSIAVFDARLEQRLAQQDARIEVRFAEQDAKFEKRFAEQDTKFVKRFAEQNAKFERRFAAIDLHLEALRTEMSERDGRLLKWLVVCWSTNTVAVVGLIVAFVTSS